MVKSLRSYDQFINNHLYMIISYHIHQLISGWWYTYPSENLKVNAKDSPIYEMENKKCLKPPASYPHSLMVNLEII